MAETTVFNELPQVVLLVKNEFKENTPSEVEIKEFLEDKKSDDTLPENLVITILTVLKIGTAAFSFIREGIKLYKEINEGNIPRKCKKGHPLLPDEKKVVSEWECEFGHKA